MDAQRITVEDVKRRQEQGEKIAFLDSRNPQAWGESDWMIPNALRVDKNEVERAIPQIPRDATIVAYCT